MEFCPQSCHNVERWFRPVASPIVIQAALPGSFLRLFIFLAGRLRRLRPLAGIPYGDDIPLRFAAGMMSQYPFGAQVR